MDTDFPATYTVHWPSGPVDACERHARELKGLAAYLGSHVAVGVAGAEAQCKNCANESRQRVAL